MANYLSPEQFQQRRDFTTEMIGTQLQPQQNQNALGALARILAIRQGKKRLDELGSQEEQQQARKSEELSRILSAGRGQEYVPAEGGGIGMGPPAPTQGGRDALIAAMSESEIPDFQAMALKDILGQDQGGGADDPAAVREYQYFVNEVLPKGKEAVKRYMALKRSGFSQGGQRYGPSTDFGARDVVVPAEETARGEATVTRANERVKTDEQLYRQAIKEGKMLVPDGQGGMEMVTIPGSEAAGEQQTKARSSAKTSGFIMRDLSLSKDLLDESADNPYVRVGKSKLLGTPEYELEQQIKSLQGTVGIESLLDIKREGAGLGQVPQTQLDLLSRLLGQLSIDRDKQITRELFDDIGMLYASTLSRMSPEDRKLAGIADREFNEFIDKFKTEFGESDYKSVAEKHGIELKEGGTGTQKGDEQEDDEIDSLINKYAP